MFEVNVAAARLRQRHFAGFRHGATLDVMHAVEIPRRSFPISRTNRSVAVDEVQDLTLHAIEIAGNLGVRTSSSPDEIAESAAATVELLAGERTAASHNVAQTLMDLRASRDRQDRSQSCMPGQLVPLLWWALSYDMDRTFDESKVAELLGWSPDTLGFCAVWQSTRQTAGAGHVKARSAMQYVAHFTEPQVVLDDHGISPAPSCT